MTDKLRYEISFFIGECDKEEAENLVEVVMGLPEFKEVGGGAIGLKPVGHFHSMCEVCGYRGYPCPMHPYAASIALYQ